MLGLMGGTMATFSACTNLDETLYDELDQEGYYNNKLETLSAVLRPYTHAQAWATPGRNGWWRLSEYAADQLAWPQKGQHGFDGGNWIRLHHHTWTADEETLNEAWLLAFGGVGYCTNPIENLESREAASMGITEEERLAYIGELKLFRAFHYLRIMDLWGNVPIATETNKTPEPTNPPTNSRQEVFEFIEKEILENVENVPVLSKEMTGRVSRAAGYAMLVELYLNAEVWTGTPRWDDCIAAADKLLTGTAGGQNGTMQLDVNITDAFKPDNHLSKEVIFAIATEFQNSTTQPQWPSEFFYFNHRDINGGGRNGNNGAVVIPGVFSTFADTDLRKKEWMLFGPQMMFSDPTKPVLGSSDEYAGRPVIFVDNIRRNSVAAANGTDPEQLPSNMTTGEGNSGVRFNKYRIGNLAHPSYNSTDWNVYRLTWINFAKAEAIMRRAGGAANADAVELINASKQRSFAQGDRAGNLYTPATLTMDELLAERGREFIFEGYRRQDLIRYGKLHTESWWDHQPSTAIRNLYPIPNRQRVLNPNLEQNEGYN